MHSFTSVLHYATDCTWCPAVAKKLSGIPDATKDIIMSRFHYRPEVKLRISDNWADAVKSLE